MTDKAKQEHTARVVVRDDAGEFVWGGTVKVIDGRIDIPDIRGEAPPAAEGTAAEGNPAPLSPTLARIVGNGTPK